MFTVGNIPYDLSEEKLREIFKTAGPVLSFKLVYDRESGKPKGYGFCEYQDHETAASAMRNLNGHEVNGRSLRVDTATNERFKEEMKNLQVSVSGNAFEAAYGTDVEPERAPEAISQVVASLPPEQMFELARQMKHCALTNPNEARNMLLQNPQLAYALLQVLVMTRCVDVNTASSILYKPNTPMTIPPAHIGSHPPSGGMNMAHSDSLPHSMPIPPPLIPQQQPPPLNMVPPSNMYDQHPHDAFNRPMAANPNFDQRHIDPRLRQGERPPNDFNPTPLDPRVRSQAIDPRIMQQPQPVQQQQPPPIRNVVPGPMNRVPPNNVMFNPPPVNYGGNAPVQGAGNVTPANISATIAGAAAGGPSNSAQSEQEKAQLIMQVLALTDQQIAMLPAEQRQSVLSLKEQLSR